MTKHTPASLLKKITIKRDSLAEAKAAHAVALAECRAASHDLATADPVDNAFAVARDNAARSAVFKANALVKRRAYALAGLEDALDAARHAAAAARAAADRALHDADLSATAEDRTAYARAVEADEEAAEAVAAATLRPTADGEAVDAVASLATLPASLVEAAREYLAAVAADCGVANAARHFGAEKDAVAFENTGDAAAEARALISAANYNAAAREIDARRARNA